MVSIIYISSCRYYFLFGLFTAALIFSTSSQAGYTFDNTTQLITNWDNAFDSVRKQFNQPYDLVKQPDTTNAPAKKRMLVKYKPQGLKNMLNIRSLTPGGLLWTAALVGTPYVWDAITGDVVKDGGINDVSGTCDVTPIGTFGAPGSSTLDQCYQAALAEIENNPIYVSGSLFTQDLWTNKFLFSATLVSNGNPANIGYFYHSAGVNSQVTIQTQTTEVLDDEFINEVAPQISWGDVVFQNDGSPTITQEYTDSLNEQNNWYTSNYTDNSVTQTTNTTTQSTTIINPDGSETTTGTESSTNDIPTFCSWAGIMCDLANWITEPETPPDSPVMPIETIEESDVVSTWSSGLGSGSCPTSSVIPMMGGGSFTQDYTIACDAAANFVYPVVIFLSLLGAGYIVAGVRRA